jgi:hypothetical protein
MHAKARIHTSVRGPSWPFAIACIETTVRYVAGTVAEAVTDAFDVAGGGTLCGFKFFCRRDIGRTAIAGVEAAQTVGAFRFADMIAKVRHEAAWRALGRIGWKVCAGSRFVDNGG